MSSFLANHRFALSNMAITARYFILELPALSTENTVQKKHR